jgi:AmmeMemoRadiSam system protein B/AmmeMemoRadiSam system protein A
MNRLPSVRRQAVAGSFYPGDPKRLRGDVAQMLAAAPAPHDQLRPVILVAPHAGYVYSGGIAAHGYRHLEHRPIRKVVVVSPSHIEFFPFVSVFAGGGYETPLGTVPVDQALARSLGDRDGAVRVSDRGHVQDDLPRREHALEVQLPFLQVVLGDFELVPVVMGHQTWEACNALGERLAPLLTRRDVLIVISTDLSHFHSYDSAKKLDATFLRLFEEMDAKRLFDAVERNDCEACGAGPVAAALVACESAGFTRGRVLHAANSGDVTGDRTGVVGYAAAAVFDDRAPAEDEMEVEALLEEPLDATDRTYLLAHARRAIEESLSRAVGPPARPASRRTMRKRGVFVTLRIGDRLRGCIGTIEPRAPLQTSVAEMAVAAAIHDPRFPPLSAEELPSIRIEISILSELTQVDDPLAIRLGRDGLVVATERTRGLLLPQVAEEFRWDALAFLQHTCEKAGLAPDAWKDEGTRVYTFSTTVFGEEEEIAR